MDQTSPPRSTVTPAHRTALSASTPSDFTYGTYNSSNILHGNNLICFGLQAPDILTGLYSNIDPAVDQLGTAIQKATDALGCPTLNNINQHQFDQYPGYTQLETEGTYWCDIVT